MDKLKFVGGVIMAEICIYFFITTLWSSLLVPAVAVADNATSAATYPLTKGFIGAAPLWLYILPAVLGLGIIVWKLKHSDKQG